MQCGQIATPFYETATPRSAKKSRHPAKSNARAPGFLSYDTFASCVGVLRLNSTFPLLCYALSLSFSLEACQRLPWAEEEEEEETFGNSARPSTQDIRKRERREGRRKKKVLSSQVGIISSLSP